MALYRILQPITAYAEVYVDGEDAEDALERFYTSEKDLEPTTEWTVDDQRTTFVENTDDLTDNLSVW